MPTLYCWCPQQVLKATGAPAEEILVYDTPTMISQIGGILSLFLGFSFFSIICDLMELIQIKMK